MNPFVRCGPLWWRMDCWVDGLLLTLRTMVRALMNELVGWVEIMERGWAEHYPR